MQDNPFLFSNLKAESMSLDSLEICRRIAHSMREPGPWAAFVDEQIRYRNFSIAEWPKLSLAYGFPGIASFYSTLDECFPDEGWDQIAFDYLQLSVQTLEVEGNSNYSLFFGIAGICFAVYLASKEGARYRNLLVQLDTILLQELERSFFPQMEKCMSNNWHSAPDLYNLLNGVCGCIAYFTLRKDEPWLNKLALRCLDVLVQALSRPRIVDGRQLPGWYVCPSDLRIDEEKQQYPYGLFDLSMSFGATGVLATLSLAGQNELIVSGQLDLIHQMAYWLKNQQKVSASGICWERCISIEEGDSSYESSRDVWDYGAPAVARSLYLASTVLKDASLGKFAEESFEKIFHKPPIEWNLIATSLTHGRAGLLAITDRMAKETGNFFLKEQVRVLEQDLLMFFNSQHTFGFRMAAFDGGLEPPYRWVDSPFFLDGSAGIALSLLSMHSYRALKWQRALLIS
ncbi:MAG: lanthionine synthetase C family protein [Parachlamydia sp.]|nr:lanthionine synthetase C family protein [Parachlamydia sp.]